MKNVFMLFAAALALCTLLTACRNGDAEETLRTVALSDGVNLEMVKIKAGTFMMGSPKTEKSRLNDERLHQVTLTRDYWLGKYEVTQAQWKAVMGNNPSNFLGDDLPVECVSWNDAMEFCEKLNEQEKAAGRLPEGYAYALPTEAQWEYACRAGTTTAYYSGNDETDLKRVSWYRANSEQKTHPVGQKEANAWGLYDMHGNVWEWCRDWYGDYPNGTVTDPTGSASGSNRAFRGCSWFNFACDCRSAIRSDFYPDGRDYDLGFRLALVPVQK